MTINQEQAKINSLNRDIAALHKKDANEARKISQYTTKLNQAQKQAQKATNESSLNSRLRESERYAAEIGKAQSQRATIADNIARKSNELANAQGRLTKKQSTEHDKRERQSNKIKKEQEKRLKAIELAAKKNHMKPQNIRGNLSARQPQHDVFISHASEDKDNFVREFAELAIENNINVWYDELSLQWGDSLRQSIDKGLANSYFGVIILSQHFFSKPWPNYELDGLIDREMSGKKCVLPIWHNISKDEVTHYSPTLAGRLALNTSIQSKQEIIDQLKVMLREIKSLST